MMDKFLFDCWCFFVGSGVVVVLLVLGCLFFVWVQSGIVGVNVSVGSGGVFLGDCIVLIIGEVYFGIGG